MRIGIDGYNLAMPFGTGVATYGYVLARTLTAAGRPVDGLFGLDVGTDPRLQETLFFEELSNGGARRMTRKAWRRRERRLWLAAANPFTAVRPVELAVRGQVEAAAFADRLPAFERIFSHAQMFDLAHKRFRMSGHFLRVRMASPPDIMHWTYPVPIWLEGARNVYTLHDLVPLKLPHTTLDEKASYRRLIAACIDRADHICTVSETSAADIAALFGVAPGRITNTYQASPMPPLAQLETAGEAAAIVRRTFGLDPQGYFLYFGAIEPKKNLGRLIEAYLSLPTETPLVVVGSRGWKSEEELALLPDEENGMTPQARAVEGRILRLQHLSRSLLVRLIRGARGVVFPSLYEGFGLPVLEAMQLGAPVLFSQTGSLPEVAGEAGIAVDPYDVASIAAGLRALDTDETGRRRFAAAGLARATLFSPERYCDRVESMYQRILGAR